MNYKKIFWGYLFLFDFRIGGFDILPDTIGFILIFLGLASLVNINDKYRTARSFAIPLIFLSIFDFFQPMAEIRLNGVQDTGVFEIVIGIAISILAILMVRGMLFGIREEAEQQGFAEIEEKVRKRWILYLAVNILLIISLVIPLAIGILFIPLLILSILSFVLILDLLKKAESSIWLYVNEPII